MDTDLSQSGHPRASGYTGQHVQHAPGRGTSGIQVPSKLFKQGKASLLPSTPKHPPSCSIFHWDTLD